MADQKVSDLPSLNGADVDAADLLYIIDSSAGAAGSKKITIGQYQLAPVSGGTANTVVYLNGSKVESSSSALTFDGTNLGIGTSSPGYKLDVNGTSRVTTEVRVKNTAGNVSYLTFEENGNGNSATFISGDARTTGNMGFWTNSTERMRLDSSGNLGIGTISPVYKLVVSNGGASGIEFGPAFSGTANLIQSYNRSGAAYVNTVYDAAEHRFNISGSEALRLDSSGNLGLGVTPSAWNASFKAYQVGNQSLWSTVAGNGYLTNNAFFNTSNAYVYRHDGFATEYIQSIVNGSHSWYTAPSGTAGNAISFTQAMTLDASGQLLLGGTSLDNPQSWGRIAQVINSGSNGAAISVKDSTNEYNIATYNGSLLFSDGISERARITSGGALLINATSVNAGEKLKVTGAGSTNATYIVLFENAAFARCFAVEGAGRIFTGTAAESPYNNTTASAANMFVDSAGVLFRSTSSLKYKTDVQDATHGLAEVMQLRSVTYKGKNDGDTVFGGLIAEEVHAAGLTEFVQYAEDGSPDALAYGNMVSLLTKAIQEQQALITALTARVAALEAK